MSRPQEDSVVVESPSGGVLDRLWRGRRAHRRGPLGTRRRVMSDSRDSSPAGTDLGLTNLAEEIHGMIDAYNRAEVAHARRCRALRARDSPGSMTSGSVRTDAPVRHFADDSASVRRGHLELSEENELRIEAVDMSVLEEEYAAASLGDSELSVERAGLLVDGIDDSADTRRRILADIVGLLGARLEHGDGVQEARPRMSPVESGLGSPGGFPSANFASLRTLSRLPTFLVEEGTPVAGCTSCPICLSALSGSVMLLPCLCCGHEQCMRVAIMNDRKCPLHRIDIENLIERSVPADWSGS